MESQYFDPSIEGHLCEFCGQPMDEEHLNEWIHKSCKYKAWIHEESCKYNRRENRIVWICYFVLAGGAVAASYVTNNSVFIILAVTAFFFMLPRD